MEYITKADENRNESQILTVPFKGDIYMGLFKFIIKALSWYHWKTFIEKKSILFTTALTKIGEDMFQQRLFSLRAKNTIDKTLGKDTIKYFGMQAIENDQITIWKFAIFNGLAVSNNEDEGFHKSTCIGAVSGPPKLLNPFRELFEE